MDLGFEPEGVITARVDLPANEFASSNAIIALFLIFAAFALVIAATGIYGVMSFAVSQRGHEISVRMALGGGGRDVVWMIAREGSRLILIGGGLGLLAALGVGRLLSSVVIGISTADPLTFGSVTALLGSVAFMSNYAPARRATEIEPVTALRSD